MPDVELGPVGERKHADALALADAAVENVPQLRTLILGIPLAEGIAEAVDAFLGAGFLLVPPRAPERRVEWPRVQRVQQRTCLQQAAAFLSAQTERAGAVRD